MKITSLRVGCICLVMGIIISAVVAPVILPHECLSVGLYGDNPLTTNTYSDNVDSCNVSLLTAIVVAVVTPVFLFFSGINMTEILRNVK